VSLVAVLLSTQDSFAMPDDIEDDIDTDSTPRSLGCTLKLSGITVEGWHDLVRFHYAP
jgi:hypothetical protein